MNKRRKCEDNFRQTVAKMIIAQTLKKFQEETQNVKV